MVFLGSREDIAHLGYTRGRCPRCGFQGMLSVFRAKRKLTVALLVAVPMNEQLVVECPSCELRFGIPPEQQALVMERLITREQLATMADRAGSFGGQAPAVREPAGRTFYQMLQVDPEADPEVIEAAFKRLAFKYHPDRSREPDAAARMREIIEAREVLIDPRKRALYDASLGIVRKPKLPEAMRASDV